jgi:hypothetical protein
MKAKQQEKRKPAIATKRCKWHEMNRKQRREMIRKLQSEDLSLEVIHPDAAGIDIGNESHYVAVSQKRDSQPVRCFGCTTAELRAMAEWLKECGIWTVAMQSTGVYWIAVFDILEEAGFEVYLVNARETKNLPGRKSDVQESQWLMKLHTYGLLRNSFRPVQEIRTMRTYWRQRNDLVRTASRHIQRIQKTLTQMNIQLANVLSDVSGVSGQTIIKAILRGERDPHQLAAFRDVVVVHRCPHHKVPLGRHITSVARHEQELTALSAIGAGSSKFRYGAEPKVIHHACSRPRRDLKDDRAILTRSTSTMAYKVVVLPVRNRPFVSRKFSNKMMSLKSAPRSRKNPICIDWLLTAGIPHRYA